VRSRLGAPMKEGDEPTLLEVVDALYWELWPYSMLGVGLIIAVGSVTRGQLLMASGGLCASVWGGIALWKRRGRDGPRLRAAELVVASGTMVIFLRELFLQWRVILSGGR
jgi:hypothetical protein